MNPSNESDLVILYVEDDAATREELAKVLRRRASAVALAADGREGLALFESVRPDLVITDVRMPVMDGLAMAREIRLRSRETPIVATTAHSETQYLLEAIEIGFDAYVLKPVDLKLFNAAVERCAGDVALRKAAARYQAEREALVRELQAAVDEIKVLQGILPICSYCKNIRDDQGYWQQVEKYVTERSKAVFSHSVCPSCFTKHYPGLELPPEKPRS